MRSMSPVTDVPTATVPVLASTMPLPATWPPSATGAMAAGAAEVEVARSWTTIAPPAMPRATVMVDHDAQWPVHPAVREASDTIRPSSMRTMRSANSAIRGSCVTTSSAAPSERTRAVRCDWALNDRSAGVLSRPGAVLFSDRFVVASRISARGRSVRRVALASWPPPVAAAA